LDTCEPLISPHDPRISVAPFRTSLLDIRSEVEAALRVEMVADRSVDGGEFLQTSHAPETEYRPLPLSEWQVRILGAVVQPATGFLAISRIDLLQRRTIGPEPVGYDGGRPTMAFH
jgi:hypothetical protein